MRRRSRRAAHQVDRPRMAVAPGPGRRSVYAHRRFHDHHAAWPDVHAGNEADDRKNLATSSRPTRWRPASPACSPPAFSIASAAKSRCSRLYAGFVTGTFLCAIAPDYVGLLVARTVAGAFGGVAAAVVLAIVGDVFPDARRGAAIGVIMSAFSVALIAGVPFGLKLEEWYSWHVPFLALGGSWRRRAGVWRSCSCRRCAVISAVTRC